METKEVKERGKNKSTNKKKTKTNKQKFQRYKQGKIVY
jgi:hypothetical protein